MNKQDEIIEKHRDQRWRREETRRVKTAVQVEEMVEELGFCSSLTDSRLQMPSVYIAVCGRRDVQAPRNVQKDPETSMAWVLKDEVIERGKVYYSKLAKGRAMFVAPRLISHFNGVFGIPRSLEKEKLSPDAGIVLKVLRKEWESSTADLREEAGFEDRKRFTKAIEDLQRSMKVVPYQVLYEPKFTYLWMLAEARFPGELSISVSREKATIELAKTLLNMSGRITNKDLANAIGIRINEAGLVCNRLAIEGFANIVAKDTYELSGLR